MRAVRAATELKKAAGDVEDAARRLTEQLGVFLVSECSASSIEYLLQSAVPVLKDSIGALCAAKPVAPGAFLSLHLLGVAGAPSTLVAPVREWLETCGETQRCASALPAPKAELVGQVSKLLANSRLEDSHGSVDHRMLTRLMSTLDPSWSWKEDDVRQMVERASLSKGSPLNCRKFSEWLFCPSARGPGKLGGEDGEEPGVGATAKDVERLAAATSSPPEVVTGGEPATSDAAQLEDALAPAQPTGQPSRPRSRPPGRPPKAKAPPPPGRPPPPGPGRSKSQPAAKAAAKATATVGRGHSQPPATQSLTLVEHLERQRGNLRSPVPAAASETANEVRDPEVVAAEERERQDLVAELRRLAARTRLGVVAAPAVAAEDAVAGAQACAPSAARPLLGRGRFASVVRSTVTVGGESAATSSSSSVPVAAKRFAASARPAGEGVSTAVVVPISALHSARREVEALLAVAGHPNVVELLGLVLPAAAEEPESSEAAAEASLASPPLQLLLGPCQGSLFGLLGNALAWEVLGRTGRVSLLLDAARGLEALHGADFAHLDIKSHNILVDPPAKVGGPLSVRVCDLGSARRVGLGQPPPPPEGTSGWSAPELLEPPLGPHSDPRLADSFSFGVVIWEVVAGPGAQHPLCGLAGEEYCKALAEGRRPNFPTHGHAPTCRSSCDEEASLAASCWQFEAAQRPRLAEVVETLGALRRKLSPAFSEAF